MTNSEKDSGGFSRQGSSSVCQARAAQFGCTALSSCASTSAHHPVQSSIVFLLGAVRCQNRRPEEDPS
jgi:hypothetical protein